MMKEILSEKDTENVARSLLGRYLVRKVREGTLRALISETEAYLGVHDPASHVFHGPTPRTKVLYGPPGHAYIYQMHRYHLLNISAESKGNPGCVLIRSVVPLDGIKLMRVYRNRGEELPVNEIANGPGKLCQALNITMDQYGTDMTDPNSELFITEGPRKDYKIIATGRIGISKAKDWKLRFLIDMEG